MGYRSELDAAHARISELEREKNESQALAKRRRAELAKNNQTPVTKLLGGGEVITAHARVVGDVEPAGLDRELLRQADAAFGKDGGPSQRGETTTIEYPGIVPIELALTKTEDGAQLTAEARTGKAVALTYGAGVVGAPALALLSRPIIENVGWLKQLILDFLNLFPQEAQAAVVLGGTMLGGFTLARLFTGSWMGKLRRKIKRFAFEWQKETERQLPPAAPPADSGNTGND